MAANTIVKVHGAAWGVSAEIIKVEISADGGRAWNAARLLGEPVQNAWRLWEYEWRTPATPGPQTLMARASDSHGRGQPSERNADRGTYMISHTLPIRVEVR